MTTYKTGNPIGSTSPKDLYDNSQNMDEATNSLNKDYWDDRLGRKRLTWEGMTRLSNLGAAVSAAERAEAAADIAEHTADMRTYFTKAEADAALPMPSGTVIRVTNDPDTSKNGYWVSNGSQWIFSGIQPASKSDLDQAISEVDRKLPFSDDSDTHAFVDADGAVVGRFDKFAELHLVGLEGSVQRVIRREGGSGDIFKLLDYDGGILLRLDEKCDLFLPGLGGKSVQEAIAEKSNAQADVNTYGAVRTPRDSFAPEVTAILANRQGSQPSAPPPLNSLPQEYSLGASWINSLTTTEPAPTPINTTYRDNDGVVHPYLCEFYNGFRGYRYILGLTGYYDTTEAEENPFVYGSNDLVSFELLDGFKQPLADRPDVPSGHNSDIFFTYDPRSGELICCWRQSIRDDGTGVEHPIMDSIWCRKTLDGYTWSDPENVFPPTRRGEDILLSPSILFDPSTFTWHLYEVKTRYIQHRTAQSLHGPWTEPVRISVPPGVTPWHLDVRWCGDKQVMLIHDNGNGTGPDNLYFGVSEGDFLTWHIGTTPVVQNVTLGMYKATFVPVFNEAGQMAMDIIWTGDAGPGVPDMKWRLLVNRTNFVNVD